MIRLSRSELLSTFFPTWIWQGREWSQWRIPRYDPYYWINAHAHPVISTYYPPNILSATIFHKASINNKWRGLISCVILHILLSFIGWLCLLSSFSNSLISLFGAITLTLAAYNWKQQPCFQYTVAWFPWMLYGIATHNTLIAGISLGLTILAGYYPIGIQTCAIAFLASIHWHTNPLWIPIGVVIGLPQLIPFIKYLPKTIRANAHDEIGNVPWWHFASLISPRSYRYNVNGVGYWEMSYYVGIIPLLTVWYTTSLAVWLLMGSICLMLGAYWKHLPRIPARWSYTFQFSLIWCAVNGLAKLNLSNSVMYVLIGLQTFDLIWHNKDLLVNHPYAELYQKPSWAFNTRLTRYLEGCKNRISGLPYPLFTGHINGLHTLGYSGGMQLKLMSKWRNDTNPNGSGDHDYFKNSQGDEKLSEYRVEYAFTTAPCNWEPTQLKFLYRNPRVASISG